jgi:hypothetical protein
MSEKQKVAENQKVDGSTGREPTEGKWVAEPREPDPKKEGDGITRLTTEERDSSTNPQNRQMGPNEEDIEEKTVEAGVESTKLDVDSDLDLLPRKLPGT